MCVCSSPTMRCCLSFFGASLFLPHDKAIWPPRPRRPEMLYVFLFFDMFERPSSKPIEASGPGCGVRKLMNLSHIHHDKNPIIPTEGDGRRAEQSSRKITFEPARAFFHALLAVLPFCRGTMTMIEISLRSPTKTLMQSEVLDD